MVLGSIEELSKIICNLLRDNIEDPVPGREGNWIYIDYPRTKLKTPMISIMQVGVSSSEVGIGHDTQHRMLVTYSIQVFVSSIDVATIDNQRYTTTKLRDYLCDCILHTILTNRNNLKRDYDILDITISNVQSIPYDPELDLYRKEIAVEVLVDFTP